MPKKKPRTPQEKKTLSYQKDRRNNHGENDKSSRKSIPLRKALENRRVRHNAKQAIGIIKNNDAHEQLAETAESSLKHNIKRKGGWAKAPDEPLRDHVARQKASRATRSKADRRQKANGLLMWLTKRQEP